MYLLLLLLFCWATPLSMGCDTGVAVPGHSLSLYQSSLANADVAFLKSYNATDLNGCINDCCTEKYGSCSVASFLRDVEATVGNCRLFNCRPVQKCRFVSSNTTDSFSFTSSGQPRVSVPSSPPPPNTTTTTTLTTSVDGPIALKNDNTTVKPRKGVVAEGLEDIFGSGERSGVKPRKGVSLEGGQSSKVKPRKGVGPQPGGAYSSPAPEKNESSQTPKYHQEISADDLASALERVFEDDVRDESSSLTSSEPIPVTSSAAATIRPSSSTDYSDVTPTSRLTTLPQTSSSSVLDSTPSSALLLPSIITTSRPEATSPAVVSSSTPPLQTTGVFVPPTPSSPTILEHSRLIFHEESGGSSESESERKYKSSMHLVLSLVFGLLILLSVLGVVAKRVYDGWMRRHYRRMDFLIDGMYNGYG